MLLSVLTCEIIINSLYVDIDDALRDVDFKLAPRSDATDLSRNGDDNIDIFGAKRFM